MIGEWTLFPSVLSLWTSCSFFTVLLFFLYGSLVLFYSSLVLSLQSSSSFFWSVSLSFALFFDLSLVCTYILLGQT